MTNPVVTASAISAGAQVLGAAFGGGGSTTRSLRKHQQRYDNYSRTANRAETAYYDRNRASWQVEGAKAAGLHPLFAMGGAPPPVASGGANVVEGQSNSGNFAKDGLKAVSGHYNRIAQLEASKELVLAQAQASALRIAENNTSNDVEVIRQNHPGFDPSNQEFKKGDYQAHKKKHPEQNFEVMSPVSTVRLGSQKVLISVEEVDTFFEDPVAVGLATYTYHGNKNVNWAQVANEWTGRKLTPAETTSGTRAMFKRLGLQMYQKANRRYRRRVKGRVSTTR